MSSLEDADRELGRLARELPPGAEMVVTADHGMIDVTGAPRWDIGKHEVLAQDVILVAGEPRALHLHLRSGTDPETVAARWQEVLGDHAVVMTRDEAERGGIFGVVDDIPRQRLGDVIVAMAGRATVVDSRSQSAGSMALVGVHGSLTPEELIVPLLIASAT